MTSTSFANPAVSPRHWPAIVIVAVAWLALFPITSVDAYYHLATGKRILDDRAIPTRGVGSATFGQAPWHDNEWGFQALTAAIGRTVRDADGVVHLTQAGRVGLIGLRAFALAATLFFLSAQMTRAGVGAGTRAIGLVLAAFLMFGNLFWDVRPQILSYLAFAATAWLLERSRSGASWALPAILVVIAIWSNVHGAFVVGIGLVACEAAGAWIEAFRASGSRAYAVRLSAATVGAGFAACLNPMGVQQVVHPLMYLAHPEIYAGNHEWTRPDLVHLPLLLSTCAILAAAVAAGARPRAAEWLRVGVYGALFLTAIRHLPILVLVLVPVTAASVASVLARRALSGRAGVAAALGAVVVIVALSGAKFVSLVPSFSERPSRPLPEAEVGFIARHGIEGNGFNAYRFGGFLMLRLYPSERVYMDGRNDLYGTFRLSTYDVILHAEPGWRVLWSETVARYKIGWALLDASEPLAQELAGDPGWRRVPAALLAPLPGAGADGIVLFLADTPENRAVLGATGEIAWPHASPS